MFFAFQQLEQLTAGTKQSLLLLKQRLRYKKGKKNMDRQVEKEIQKLITKVNINCSIREFKDEVSWDRVSRYQKLSENFIREFKDKVDWDNISECQKLLENFIREFKDEVSWDRVSRYQKLSENFIREFKDEVNWDYISEYQKLSENFIREFKDEVNIKLQKEVHQEKTYQQKLTEITQYAKTHNLKFKDNCLCAYRNHDNYGRGVFNKTIFYKKAKYYKDWHCDMRENVNNSFGLGIFPKGNTKVKIKVEDWGVAINREDGKARVWGFEVVSFVV